MCNGIYEAITRKPLPSSRLHGMSTQTMLPPTELHVVTNERMVSARQIIANPYHLTDYMVCQPKLWYHLQSYTLSQTTGWLAHSKLYHNPEELHLLQNPVLVYEMQELKGISR
jgi:hypothetical protein